MLPKGRLPEEPQVHTLPRGLQGGLALLGKPQPPLGELDRLEATFCESDAITAVVIYAKKFCRQDD